MTMNGSKQIISAQGVRKRFGAIEVLKGVSMTVNAGEVVCIVGPSGSGKSTFLRLLNGLEEITGGSIDINGTTLPARKKDLMEVRREVGMVFQSFNLFPHMTIRQNITLGPIRTGKLTPAEADKRAVTLLERVGIGDQKDKHPAQLSGGQQQRAAIARALAMEPRVLLFDEPTSALDPENVNEVLSVMKELAKTGITMIVVTHEMGFAREVADRIVFMAEGEIMVDAEPEAFFKNASDPRLKTFLSKMF